MALTRIQPSALDITLNYRANTVTANYITFGDGTSQTTSATTIGQNAYNQANTATIIAQAAYAQANTGGGGSSVDQTARTQANTSNTVAISAYVQANTANTVAIASYIQANTATIISQAAYGRANSEIIGTAAYVQANTANTVAIASYVQANTATIIGQAAYVQANSAAQLIPQNPKTTDYILQSTDIGKHIYYTQATSSTLYIPPYSSVPFANGSTVMIISQTTSSANVTVTPNTGVSLFLAGSSTSASRNVTTYGMASLIQVAANTWFINGTGVV